MKRFKWLVFGSAVVGVFLVQPLWGGDACNEAAIIKAVDEAVGILEKEGDAGLAKVGSLRFCGDNYVFVNDLKGKTLMHISPHLIGKVLIELKDDTGKRFFAEFTEVTQKSKGNLNGTAYFNGNGWVKYRWPKPGEKEMSPKITYIKGCLMGQTNVYVGAGYYQ